VNLSLTIVQTRQRRARTEASEELAVAVPSRASSRAEELHRKLYEAIALLNPKAASILILRYLHNYSDADIATLLGTSRGVIAVTLYRSRARLKKLMALRWEKSHETGSRLVRQNASSSYEPVRAPSVPSSRRRARAFASSCGRNQLIFRLKAEATRSDHDVGGFRLQAEGFSRGAELCRSAAAAAIIALLVWGRRRRVTRA
jgi:hypothetical protein